MSSRASGILGLILLPLALLIFIGSGRPHHPSEPVEGSIEIEAPALPKMKTAQLARRRETPTITRNSPAPMTTLSVPNGVPTHAALSTLPPVAELVQNAWKHFDEASRVRPDAIDAQSLPRHLFPVSAAVARVGMAMRNDPNAIPAGMVFFRGCAAADSDLFSVRAVCLRNLKYWSEKTGGRDADLPSVPDEVARIVSMLPPAR